MYLSPYTKHDDELVDLLVECIDELAPEVQKDYLINVLTEPKYKNMTVKEVLEFELKAKHEFLEELAKRKNSK